MVLFDSCKAVENVSPVVALPPFPDVPLPNGPLPFETQLLTMAGSPPMALLLAGGVLLATIVVLWTRLASRPWIRRTATGGAVGSGVAVVVLAAAWGTLHLGLHYLSNSDYRAATTLTGYAAAPFNHLKWVDGWENNPAAMLSEAAATQGIRLALQAGNTNAAVALAEVSAEPTTPPGRRARSVAFASAARVEFADGEFTKAIVDLHRAREAEPTAPELADAIDIARGHAVVNLTERRQYADAHQQLGAFTPGWRSSTQAALAAQLARAEVQHHLDDHDADYSGALERLNGAWAFAQTLHESPAPLECDIAGVLELQAEASLVSGDPATAVSLLARAEGHVSGSPFAAELWPIALHFRGRDEIESGDGAVAVSTLDAALARHPADPAAVVQDLVRALALRSAAEERQRAFGAALTTAIRARDLRPTSDTTERVNVARINLAEWSMRTGDWRVAAEQLQSLRGHQQFGGLVSVRLAELNTTSAEIARLRRLWWARLPDIRGRLAVDTDVDGDFDGYTFTIADGSVVGWADVSNPWQISFLDSADPSRVVAMVRDTDRNGDFDEFVQRTSPHDSFATMDLDADNRPDIVLRYGGDRLVERTPLSGRVMFRLRSAAIRGGASDGPLAGEIDPYFTVHQNAQFMGRSRTITNTSVPSWDEGTVIDYRYGDRVSVFVFDEDLFFDDAIDEAHWSTLPVTEMVTTVKRNAVLDVHVSPTTLPVGYRFIGPPSTSRFREPGIFSADSIVGRIVNDAVARDARAQVVSRIERIVGTELLVMALVPNARIWTQLGVGAALDFTVGEYLFPVR